MRDGQGRPTPKRATNLANTADILLWENLITQWHLFMEKHHTIPHCQPAGGWLVQQGSLSQAPYYVLEARGKNRRR